MVENVFDLPVIIQGALGSFLFWLAYILFQKVFNLSSILLGKSSNFLQKENALYEQLHLLQDVTPIDSSLGNRVHLVSIQAALYKFIQGVIFLTFALISSEFMGVVSVVAYVFAIYFFFRALKACYVESGSSGMTKLEKEKRIDELAVILGQEPSKSPHLTGENEPS
jgi:hypothetical protein